MANFLLLDFYIVWIKVVSLGKIWFNPLIFFFLKEACTLVQFSSVTQSCPALCNPMNCSTPGLPVHHQLPESTQTHAHWVGDAIQPSHPLSSPSPLPSILPSIRVFSNESALHTRWPEYWSFSFNISPSNEHPGLISFKMDWLDLLAVQGTLKNLLQHHSSKASILRHSSLFIVQLLHPYINIPHQQNKGQKPCYHLSTYINSIEQNTEPLQDRKTQTRSRRQQFQPDIKHLWKTHSYHRT